MKYYECINKLNILREKYDIITEINMDLNGKLEKLQKEYAELLQKYQTSLKQLKIKKELLRVYLNEGKKT